ncbi:hypothetical protein [Helicobacter vulpis]|uniref:hypothetical protein n=1 Tax=Helicobacter vulpis TaxID=2316076 RepID=UPI000EABEB8E|nr:hypothetical protein [Helicobacter vulpis]
MPGLDFEGLENAGVSPQQVLDFVRANTHNFNFEGLEKFYTQQGFNPEQRTRALYTDIKNFKQLNITPKKQEAEKQDKDQYTPPLLINGFKDPKTPPSASLQAPPPLKPTQDIAPPHLVQPKGTQSPKNTQEPSQQKPPLDPKAVLEEINTRAEALEKRAPGFLKQGLLDTLEVFSGQRTGEHSALLGDYHDLILKAIEHKIPYAKLPQNLKEHLFSRNRQAQGVLGWGTSSGEQEYQDEIKRQSILKVQDPSQLTDAQKHLIYKDRNLFTTLGGMLFKSQEEDLKDYQEDTKSRYIGARAARDLVYLNNTDPTKSLFSLFSDPDPKKVQAYQQAVGNVLNAAGFEKALFKEGRVYGVKDGQTYRINENFFDHFMDHISANAGSLTGSLLGAGAGFTRGLAQTRTPWGAIAGAAIGASLGGGLDYALSNYVTKREANFADMAHYMLEQGALSALGDGVILAGAKAFAGGKWVAQNLGKVSEYIPGIGMVQRFMNGNVKAAQKVLAEVYTPQQEAALKEFAKHFGGQARFNAKANALNATMRARFGEDSKIFQAYQSVEDILKLSKQSAQQEAFMRAIRAMRAGRFWPF